MQGHGAGEICLRARGDSEGAAGLRDKKGACHIYRGSKLSSAKSACERRTAVWRRISHLI